MDICPTLRPHGSSSMSATTQKPEIHCKSPLGLTLLPIAYSLHGWRHRIRAALGIPERIGWPTFRHTIQYS